MKKFKLPTLRKPTGKEVKGYIIYFAIVLFGNLIAAGASALFIIPCGLAMGGTTGIGIFISNFWENEFAVTIIVYIANFFLFIVGSIFLGAKFAAATALGSLLYPTFIGLVTSLNNSLHGGRPLTEDPLLASICGALLFGLGIGIVVRVGASTGGTDIPPLILHKFFGFPVSAGLWILDMSIVLLQLIAKDVEVILYGVIITLLSSVVIEKISPIGMKRTQVKIVSQKYEEIREMILSKINRGVTTLYGQTGFLKEDCHMLLTIISHRELVKLKTLVQEIDPEAFMTVSIVSEVRGRGFTSEGIKLTRPQAETIVLDGAAIAEVEEPSAETDAR